MPNANLRRFEPLKGCLAEPRPSAAGLDPKVRERGAAEGLLPAGVTGLALLRPSRPTHTDRRFENVERLERLAVACAKSGLASTELFCIPAMSCLREIAVQRIIIHLGAHRCGSTTIQRALKSNRERLAKDSVAVLTRREIVDDARLARLMRLHRQPLGALPVAFALSRMPERTVVLSEENILGLMPGLDGTAALSSFWTSPDGHRIAGEVLRLFSSMGRATTGSFHRISIRISCDSRRNGRLRRDSAVASAGNFTGRPSPRRSHVVNPISA